MPQITVYIREEDIEKWRGIQKKSRFMSVALNTLSEKGMDFLEEQHQMYDTPTPIKREVIESPPLIRNLADEYTPKQYDKSKPFWSPFGPLPVRQNPLNPTAVIDPNYDDERQMPLDVDKRNAYIERDE